jgi:hypothetical protein
MLKTAARFLLTIMAAATFVSCGESGRVDGMPAGDYYKQFLYVKQQSGSSMTYGYLDMADGARVVLDNVGSGIVAYSRATLFLQDNKSYTLIYDEFVGCSNGSNNSGIKTFHKAINGSWSVQDSDLRLDNVANASRIQQNSVQAMELEFLQNINSTGLFGKSPYLYYVQRHTGLEDYLNDSGVTAFDQAVQQLQASRVCGGNNDR